MGRGRQKAKQTKVARALKYTTPDTDYRALERELSSGSHAGPTYADPSFSSAPVDGVDEDDDEFDEDEVDDANDWAPQR